jgi:hypothetical protein
LNLHHKPRWLLKSSRELKTTSFCGRLKRTKTNSFTSFSQVSHYRKSINLKMKLITCEPRDKSYRDQPNTAFVCSVDSIKKSELTYTFEIDTWLLMSLIGFLFFLQRKASHQRPYIHLSCPDVSNCFGHLKIWDGCHCQFLQLIRSPWRSWMMIWSENSDENARTHCTN